MSTFKHKPIPSQSADQTALYSWNVRYAAVRHNGATLKNGTVMPAAPWTERAVEAFSIEDTFAALLDRGETLEGAFKKTAALLGAEFTKAISSQLYSWPRDTVRATGELAGSPRNIVDRGGLRASQKLEFIR